MLKFRGYDNTPVTAFVCYPPWVIFVGVAITGVGGALAGAVHLYALVGVVLGVIVLIAGIVLCVKRRRSESKREQEHTGRPVYFKGQAVGYSADAVGPEIYHVPSGSGTSDSPPVVQTSIGNAIQSHSNPPVMYANELTDLPPSYSEQAGHKETGV